MKTDLFCFNLSFSITMSWLKKTIPIVLAQALIVLILNSPPAHPFSPAPNWPVTIGAVNFSSPLAEDLDLDGTLEIAAFSWDDRLHLLSFDGNYLPNGIISTDPVDNSGETSSPSAGDFNGDGYQELVFAADEGKLYILSLTDNADQLQQFDLGATILRSTPALGLDSDGQWVIACGTCGAGVVLIWPKSGRTLTIAPTEEITSTPALADINRDGELDVVFGKNDGGILAYSIAEPGFPLWELTTDGPVQSSVALGDIDGDQYLEGFVGSLDGNIYGFDCWGKPLPGWPLNLGGGYADEGIISSPALGDINRDGFLEIIVGTGIFSSTYGRLLVIDRMGNILTQKETDCGIISSPLLVNLDDDIHLEILAISYDGEVLGIEADGSNTEGYPGKISPGPITATPTVNDLDGDGYQELLVASDAGLLMLYNLDAPHQFSAWNTFHGSSDHDGVTLYIPSPQEYLTLNIDFDGEAPVLSWNNIIDADEYRIQRSFQDHPQDFSMIATLREDPLIFRDTELTKSGRYFYKVSAYRDDSELLYSNLCSIDISQSLTQAPHSQITANYPNPFSTSTTIDYIMGEAQAEQKLELAVFDITGKKLATLIDDYLQPGSYSIDWDGLTDEGNPVASGVYFLRLSNGIDVSSRTLVVVH